MSWFICHRLLTFEINKIKLVQNFLRGISLLNIALSKDDIGSNLEHNSIERDNYKSRISTLKVLWKKKGKFDGIRNSIYVPTERKRRDLKGFI